PQTKSRTVLGRRSVKIVFSASASVSSSPLSARGDGRGRVQTFECRAVAADSDPSLRAQRERVLNGQAAGKPCGTEHQHAACARAYLDPSSSPPRWTCSTM